jgi:hypothetical protein
MSTDQGYVVFDIETNSLIPAGFIDAVDSPPCIFCVATMEMQRAGADGAYYLQAARSWPSADSVTELPLSAIQICQLVDYMWNSWNDRGLRICAWNGAGFDMRIIAAHVKHCPVTHDRALKLTWELCDPMFAFFMTKGFPVGLNAVAKAGRAGFCKTGSGSDVNELWSMGHKERLGVLAYCIRDVEVTAVVVSEIEATSQVKWIAKSGKTAVHRYQGGVYAALASVSVCNNLKLPDTSWMNEPISKTQFTGWLNL